MNTPSHKQDIDALWLPIIQAHGCRPVLAIMFTDNPLKGGTLSDSVLNSCIQEASKLFDCRLCGATFSNTKDLIHKIQLLGNSDFDALCILSKGGKLTNSLLNDAEVVETVKNLSTPTISAIECQGDKPAICAITDKDFDTPQLFGEYLKDQAAILLPTAAPILAQAKEEAARRKAEETANRQAYEAAKRAAEAAKQAAAQQDKPAVSAEQEVERLNKVLSEKLYEISQLKRKLRRRKTSVVVAYILLGLVLAAIAVLYYTGLITLNL